MTTKSTDTTFIRIIHPVCCGLDVHRKNISACLVTVDEHGKEHYEIKEFGTFTDDLEKMKKWLIDNNCSVIAMESTRPDIPEIVNLQDVKGQAKPYQIKQFLKLVEKHNLKLEEK
jgi:hypothetical protein